MAENANDGHAGAIPLGALGSKIESARMFAWQALVEAGQALGTEELAPFAARSGGKQPGSRGAAKGAAPLITREWCSG